MKNSMFENFFESKRKKAFKNAKKCAWVCFILFLLAYYLPSLFLSFIYPLIVSQEPFFAAYILLGTSVFIIFYFITFFQLYLASKSKDLLVSFFASLAGKIICLALTFMNEGSNSTFIYQLMFISFMIAAFYNFVFFKTLKTLCENHSYFMLCFYLELLALFAIIAETLWFEKLSFSFAKFFTWIELGLFAYCLYKNEQIKLCPKFKNLFE